MKLEDNPKARKICSKCGKKYHPKEGTYCLECKEVERIKFLKRYYTKKNKK